MVPPPTAISPGPSPPDDDVRRAAEATATASAAAAGGRVSALPGVTRVIQASVRCCTLD